MPWGICANERRPWPSPWARRARDLNPGTAKERLVLIEELAGPALIELMALRLVIRLLFEAEADIADDEDRPPLDVEVALVLDEMIDEIESPPKSRRRK